MESFSPAVPHHGNGGPGPQISYRHPKRLVYGEGADQEELCCEVCGGYQEDCVDSPSHQTAVEDHKRDGETAVQQA